MVKSIKKKNTKKKSVNKSFQKKKQNMEKNKKNKNKKERTLFSDKALFGGIFVLLLIFFGIIYAINRSVDESKDIPTEVPIDNTVVYNGYKFYEKQGIWETEMQITDNFKGWSRKYNFLFHYNPYEVEDISSMKNSKNESTAYFLIFRTQNLYITFDPNQEGIVLARTAQASVELAKIISQVYEKEVSGATTEVFSENYPVIDCMDATDTTSVIYLKLGNETKVYNDGLCLVVQGTNETELLRASEKLSFELLKIIK